jgi:glycosyltransferase involved in cell wall biosynthesis
MRILSHVVSLERLGGIEVSTLEVSRALAARGHDVHLVYGVPVTALSNLDMRTDLEAAGITLHGPHNFYLSPKRPISSLASFGPPATLAARLRPDVLWLQRFEMIFWGHTVSRRSGTPMVCHLHHAPMFRRGTSVLARGVTQFVAVSDFMRRRWVDAGVDARRVRVVHNAVPPQAYRAGGTLELRAARQALELPLDVPTALYYGRFEKAKGLGVALDAWDDLSLRPEQAHLVLAGDFPPDAPVDLRTRVAERAANGRATVLPGQRDVLPLLHAADVVVFPSLLDEAFGRVVLEGLVTQRPVVGSDIGGVPEILAGPLDRLLVPPGDAAALASTLASMLRWRQDEPGLGELCRWHAEARFSFDTHVEQLEAVLGESAGRHRRSTVRD